MGEPTMGEPTAPDAASPSSIPLRGSSVLSSPLPKSGPGNGRTHQRAQRQASSKRHGPRIRCGLGPAEQQAAEQVADHSR